MVGVFPVPVYHSRLGEASDAPNHKDLKGRASQWSEAERSSFQGPDPIGAGGSVAGRPVLSRLYS